MVFASNKSFGGSGKLETWPIYTSHKILIGAPADPGQPRRAALKGAELAWPPPSSPLPGPHSWHPAREGEGMEEKGPSRAARAARGEKAGEEGWGALGAHRASLGKLRHVVGSPQWVGGLWLLPALAQPGGGPAAAPLLAAAPAPAAAAQPLPAATFGDFASL